MWSVCAPEHVCLTAPDARELILWILASERWMADHETLLTQPKETP